MYSRHFKQFEQESKHCVLEAIKFLTPAKISEKFDLTEITLLIAFVTCEWHGKDRSSCYDKEPKDSGFRSFTSLISSLILTA